MKKGLKKSLAALSMFAVLAACGGQASPKSEENKGAASAANPPAAAAVPDEKFKDPVTINFFYNGYSGSLMDDWKARVKEKYNIILNPYLDQTIENLIASGVKLDLVAYSAGGLFKALDLQLTSDLTDLVKKYNFDLNKLAPGVLESAKMYSDKGEFPVMPYELNNNVVIYPGSTL